MAQPTDPASGRRCRLIAAATGATLSLWLGFPRHARSDLPATDACHQSDTSAFGTRGTFEFGGAVSANWTTDLFVLNAGPQFGYFFLDHWQLSLLFTLIYQNVRNADGTREGTLFHSTLLEPSYHPPLSDSLTLLGGLGIGYQRENGHNLFELAPRVGVNFLVGRAVLTPAITVPILVGDHAGTGTTQVTAGVLGELEISVAW